MHLTSVDTAPTPTVVASPISVAQDSASAPTLPWWALWAFLGGLTGFCAAMIGMALLVIALMPDRPAEPIAQAVRIDSPKVIVPAAPVEAPPQEEPVFEMPMLPELPREEPKLARRMPSSAVDLSPVQRPAVAVQDNEPVKTALATPIRWSVETQAPSKRDPSNLIAPIEVARIEQGAVHYTLRRLRFPDDAKPLKLAVTPYSHDDVARVLKGMGDGYRFTNIRNEDTWSLATLRNYDVVFLTCADMYAQDFQAAWPLRRFVEMGGTLYASDLRGDLLLAAFPEFRARMPYQPGVPQSVEANVIDAGLQSYLGRKTIPLTFDAPNWRPGAFDASKATVCLKGAYRNNAGETWSAPLLVKFRAGKGTVIFTSFHHCKNDSAIVQKLLEYLVFSSVSARSEARVKELMLRSQFAADDLRPAFVSAEQKVEGECRHAGGDLQIALGFENLGAKLKLTLRSPSGQTIEHADEGLYLIELPKAEAGVWQYTVTPVALPHANFPILIAVGKARE